MKMIANTPILGFAAFSGTGKTTLLEKLIPKLTQAGLRLGVLKHAHHNFDIDQAGKDSYRLRKAGATQMYISSRYRHALITETAEQESTFEALLNQFDHQHLDLILIEGFKSHSFPKIELRREALQNPWMHTSDSNIIAVATDIAIECSLPKFNIDDLDHIAQFVINYTQDFSKQTTDKSSDSSSPTAVASCDTLSPAFLSVEQGQARILNAVSEIEGEEICSLENALHQIIATDIQSNLNVPQHTNSAMDGYAIRDEDIKLEKFLLVGEVMAGHHYPHPLKMGEAVKIMTGAPIPINGTTVVMREQAQEVAHNNLTYVTFNGAAVQAGQNVRAAGEDLAVGQVVFKAGTKIRSAELGMLASLGSKAKLHF
jgi:molybdopterin molybdotransferase